MKSPTVSPDGWPVRLRAVLTVCLTIATVGNSCTRDAGPPPARSHVLRDDAGRIVPDSPAARIVSLQPATTELLFALGAGERVVGRSRWDAFPPEVRTIPDVGDAIRPNVEAIAAREPDVVILYPANANEQVERQLQALDITTVSLRMDSLGSVPRAARILGRIAGEETRADSVAAAFARWLDSARTAPRPDSGPSAAIITWDNPPIVIAAGSFLSELVWLAGARNVFDDLQTASAQVTIEAIASRDPDLLLFVGESEQPPDFIARPEWRVVGAVREGRVVHVSGPAFSWPSPRAPGAVERLRMLLDGVDR